MNDELLLSPISEIRRLFRDRRLSPVELADMLLDRIEVLQPVLNAYVTVAADELREGARAAEQRLVDGKVFGPLEGIPVSVKDNIATAGLPTTAGSPILRGWIPARDAACVAALRRAGALIVGKTQLFQFAFGEAHPDFGHVANPWDTDRSTGGSSSGAVAAVAAGLCFGSVATDAGGSIRVPAALCGVVGHKPTFDLVDRTGVIPTAWSLSHVGPVGRTVEDTASLLEALRPGFRVRGLGDGVEGLRLAVSAFQPKERIDEEVAEAVHRAVGALEAQGAKLTPVELPDLLVVRATLWAIAAAEAADYHTDWLRDRPEDYHPIVRARLERGWDIPAAAYVRAQRVRRWVTDRLAELLEGMDALIMPVSPITAYPLGSRIAVIEGHEEEVAQAVTRYTPLASLTGRPALSVPCGLSSEGLPIGLQVIGHPGDDSTVLRIGHTCQRGNGWVDEHPHIDELVKGAVMTPDRDTR